MYPLGHVAAACGTAWLAQWMLDGGRGDDGWNGMARRVDYRLVAFGTLLPDLVDKPSVWFILRDSEMSGHHVGHSVLFAMVLLLFGLVLAARGDGRAITIAFGDMTHLAYDSVMHIPWSLLWPFVELDVPHNGTLLRSTNIAGEVVALVAMIYLLSRSGGSGRAQRLVRDGHL